MSAGVRWRAHRRAPAPLREANQHGSGGRTSSPAPSGFVAHTVGLCTLGVVLHRWAVIGRPLGDAGLQGRLASEPSSPYECSPTH
jgi:hypothetical protein